MRDGLQENYVKSMARDTMGYIYIATFRGVDVFDGNRLYPLRVQAPANFSPERIAFDSRGHLLAVHNDSLLVYDGQEFTDLYGGEAAQLKIGLSEDSILRNAQGIISDFQVVGSMMAAVTRGGSLIFNSGRGPTTHMPGLAGGFGKVAIGSDRKIWIYDGMSKGIAYVDLALGAPHMEQLVMFSDILVKDVTLAPNGDLYVATNSSGIYRLNRHGQVVGHHTMKSEGKTRMPTDHMASVLTAGDCLLGGTTKAGMVVMPLRRPGFRLVDTGEDADISFFRQRPDGSLLIGYDGAGLALYDSIGATAPRGKKNMANSALPSDLVIGYSTAVHPTVFSTYGGGIFQFVDDRPVLLYNTPDVLYARHLLHLNPHRLLAGTFEHGLVDIGHATYNHRNSPLRTNSIMVLAEFDSQVLVGTSTGLYVFDPEKGEVLEPESPFLADLYVSALHVDSRGLVWVATPEALMVLNHSLQPIATLTRSEGLTSNLVRAIMADREGDIWATTTNGINRIEMATQPDGSIQFNVEAFYPSDWMGDIEFDRHSILLTRKGRLLAGGMGKYLVVDPAAVPKHHEARKVYVSGVLIDDQPVSGKSFPYASERQEQIEMEYYNTLTLQLTTLSVMGDANTRFEYRFEGEDEWRWADTPDLRLGRLTPGSHTMEIRSAASPDTSLVKIKVKPPFWHAWWAYLVYAAVGISAAARIWFMVRRRHQRNISQKITEEYLSRAENNAPSPEEIFINQVKTLIEDNLADEQFSVDALSDKLNMSRSNLYKKLRTATGRTPVEFIRYLRIRRGMSLLAGGETSVSQIAYKVGMAPRIFSKYFKEEYGVTPSEYLKREEEKPTEQGEK